jgi:uncharacterized membrane protein
MRLPKITSLAILVMFVLTATWLTLVVVSPFLVPSGTLTDLSGRVGYRDNSEVISELDTIPRVVYWVGDSQCHQLVDRSYFLNDNQMPFCARDIGLFIGLAVASGIALFYVLAINPVFLLLGLAPIGVDGGLQLVTSYESTNALRLVTGIIAGLVLAFLLAQFIMALREGRDVPSDDTSEPQNDTYSKP